MRNLALIPLLAVGACALSDPPSAPDVIWRGGSILTMAGATPTYVEALAVRDGRIVAMGRDAEILARQGEHTIIRDLAGRTLMPGFVDPHSHIAGHVATFGTPVLAPPPVGEIRSIADLQRVLRHHIEREGIPKGKTVLATGYDDSLLLEQRHPDRHDLDAVSTEHPIILGHASGHLLAVNSLALTKASYGKDTTNPRGGVIRREEDGSPSGVVEELAALPFLGLIEPLGMDEQVSRLDGVQAMYASFGITTAQDGISMANDIALLREAAKRGRLVIDVVSYPRWDMFDDVLSGKRTLDIDYHPPMLCGCESVQTSHVHAPAAISESSRTQVGIYQGRLKFGGVKISADGSPQGKTAWLTAPYVVPPAGLASDYRGYGTVTDEAMQRWFDVAYEHDVQLLVHCNGDAAADQMIAAARRAQAKFGKKDLRPVMIHAQMIRQDQVAAMVELGIVPSFFTAHTFYWGDWHVAETVGPERAAGMSPTATAQAMGLRFTNHTDAPVVPPNQFDLVWTAVTRQSRSGAVIGPGQRIDRYSALRAITIDAAWQYFEERHKGSLEVGKLADLIVVEADPLEVPIDSLRSLAVLETIKDGKTIWQRPTD